MVLADTPEKSAMENEAPAVSDKLPNLIRGLAIVAILLVQFSDSIKVATSRPRDIKQSRRMSGQIRLSQISERMSGDCIVKKDVALH